MIDYVFGVTVLAVFVLIYGIGIFQGFGWEYIASERKKRRYWRTLADANNLTFVQAKLLEGSHITGNYGQHAIKLDTIYDWKTTYTRTSIQLKKISTSDGRFDQTPEQQKAVEKITPLLTVNLSPSMLKYGQIEVSENGQVFYLENFGLEANEAYLKSVFDLMSNLADAYPVFVNLGGEFVSIARTIAQQDKHPLQQVATQLLLSIQHQTTTKYSKQPSRFLCDKCLARFAPHKLKLSEWRSITYFGCRLCGQSQDYLETSKCWVVALLDNEGTVERSEYQGVLRVNRLINRVLFDFDEVEIIRATDEEVERFAVQVGNDTDPIRKEQYQKVQCTISSDCHLTENTLRILRSMFGGTRIKEGLESQMYEEIRNVLEE